MTPKENFNQYMTRKDWQHFFDQNVDGLKWVNVHQYFFKFEKINCIKNYNGAPIMEDETII